MAIAFVRTKIVGRSNGQSAVASASYRSGQRLHDARYAKTHDYGRKGGIIATGIEAPEGSPAWVFDRERLWNKVEATEIRKDARLARELILALPHELPMTDQVELTRAFADTLAAQGMGVDWAVHHASKEGVDTNVHAHLLCTTREITPEGFGGKHAGGLAREWNKDSWLEGIKRQYESMANERLQARGYAPISFDDRAGRGGPHLGPVETRKWRKAVRELKSAQAEVGRAETERDTTLAEYDRQIEAMWKARDEERRQEAEARARAAIPPAPAPTITPTPQPAPRQPSPLEQLAQVVEASKAKGAGRAELERAAATLKAVRELAGARAGEYPEIGAAARAIRHTAARRGLVLDAKTGLIREMTRREREDLEAGR